MTDSWTALPDRIVTDRLVLRPFAWSDADALYDYASDPEYARFQSGPDDYTRAASDRFLAELMLHDPEVRPVWAITQDDRVMGIVSLSFESGHRIAVLGYGLHRRLWGQGLAGEAVGAVLDAAFTDAAALQRVRAHTDARNGRSIAVLQKLGFAHEGLLRRNAFSHGEYCDEAVFGLLREEWTATPR